MVMRRLSAARHAVPALVAGLLVQMVLSLPLAATPAGDAAALPAGAAPGRVLSMNLCTDQLALMIAAPGQLVSVSWLSHDPASSAMVDKARALPANHAQAEEIFLMQPDLVLAGRWSAPATLRMMQRLEIPVAVFDIETDLAGIRANIARMGAVLGQKARADALLARFDADLARLEQPAPMPRPRAALYAIDGYSSGTNSLAGQILDLAGYDNIADDLGLEQGGYLALESLLLAEPDLIVQGRRYAGQARAQEKLDHPALHALAARRHSLSMAEPDWVCGTPHILNAVAALARARGAMTQ